MVVWWSIDSLTQGWANFLTSVPQRVLKFNRRAGPGADRWGVLVIYLMRRNTNRLNLKTFGKTKM